MNHFSADFLARLRKIRIVITSLRTGNQKGIRRSYKIGSSLEFSDFRSYQPGDDIRQIDWNVYGRTKRHYIKRYLDEQEIRIAIYLDCTSSMRIMTSKWNRAKELASALSYISLENEDQLTFVPISGSIDRIINRRGSVNGKAVMFDILNLDFTEVTKEFVEQCTNLLQKGKQMNIIISDGMEPIAHYEQLFRRIASQKSKSLFVQLLSKQEMEPTLIGDAKLVDSEMNSEINVSLNTKLIAAYKGKLAHHNEELKRIASTLGIKYVLISDERSVEEIIMKEFVSSGIVQ